MLSKFEKKLLNIKTVKVEHIKYDIKRCTPEDFLGKEGVPISKWQSEADFLAAKESSGKVTLPELRAMWLKLFKKAIVAIQGKDDNLDILIELLVEDNYYASSELYNEIVKHTLGFQKKKMMSRLSRRTLAFH